MQSFRFLFGLICTSIIVMIEVPPDHALTPFAEWFRIGGMSGVADWLDGAVSKSALPWAVWVLAAIAFICFFGVPLWHIFKRLLNAYAKRHSTQGAVKDWKTPVEAIEAFSNESIRNERDRLEQEAARIRAVASEAEQAIGKIYESYPTGFASPKVPPDIVADYDQWREKLSTAAFAHDAATQARGEADCQLLRQIVQQLAQGKLIAKGFRMPRDGLGETEIPQSEWRSVKLDPIKATASHYRTEIFTGILIGKPEGR